MRVKDLMSERVVTAAPADSGLDAVARMVRMRVRHLPVVNREGMLVGIVTDRDLRHYLLAPHVFDRLREGRVDAGKCANAWCHGEQRHGRRRRVRFASRPRFLGHAATAAHLSLVP